ncbi:Hypothetical predicted protein [Podarcis lilfordi]|nr:Hypothetical predicted protein [Podarcis lilfordi]
MKAFGPQLLLLLALLGFIAGQEMGIPLNTRTCASWRGLCRRSCLAYEIHLGVHGCPRHYRCCVLRT